MNLDINECIGMNNPCSENAECINSGGSVQCLCLDGFQGDGFTCEGKINLEN